MVINKTLAQQTAHQLAIDLSEAVQKYEFRHPQLSLHKLNGRTYLGWLADPEHLSKPESAGTWIFPEIYTDLDPNINCLPLTHEQATKFIEFYNSL
jgi:hypothetical protein